MLDPRSGQPKVDVGATAVIMGNATRADVASTALMVAGPKDFARIARSLHAACAMLLTDDDHLYIMPAMQRRITLLRKPASMTVTESLGERCE